MGGADDFLHDADGLLTQAGDLMLMRNASTGLLDGTTLRGVTTTQTLNAFGELVDDEAVLDDGLGGTVLYRNDTTLRDKLGRIRARTETIEGSVTSYEYTYDAAGRLEEVKQDGVVVRSYGYDDNGNRLRSQVGPDTQVYDDQDRLVSSGGGAVSYSYTDHGDLATRTEGGDTTTYRTDAPGNLLQVVLPAAETSRRFDRTPRQLSCSSQIARRSWPSREKCRKSSSRVMSLTPWSMQL